MKYAALTVALFALPHAAFGQQATGTISAIFWWPGRNFFEHATFGS